MSDSANLAAAMLAQVTKLLRGMSDDDLKRVASGDLVLALLSRPTVKAVGKLTEDDLRQVDEGTARLALLRKGDKVLTPFDAVEVAEQIVKLTSEADVVRLLDADPRLGAPNLRKVASELNIEIPASVKAKPALQLHIAKSVIRDRGHWNWR